MGAERRMSALGSILAVMTKFSRTAALERIADIIGGVFQAPWNERQLSPKAAIQNRLIGLPLRSANGQERPFVRFLAVVLMAH